MNGKKIMIIDDDKDLLLGLAVRLKAGGYTVVCAMDAVMAMTTARKEEPDLVLLDLGLPGGDGFVVLDRLRSLAAFPAVPVIVLSAWDPARNKERALKAGASAFFQKPAANHELLATIRHCLHETNAPVPAAS